MSTLNIISENKPSVVDLKPPPVLGSKNRTFMIKKEDDDSGDDSKPKPSGPRPSESGDSSLKNNQFQFKTDYASASSEEEFLEPSSEIPSKKPSIPSFSLSETSSKPPPKPSVSTSSSIENKKPSFGMRGIDMDVFVNPEKKASPMMMQRKSEEFSDEEEDDEEDDGEDDEEDDEDLSSEGSMSDSTQRSSRNHRRSRPKKRNHLLSKDEVHERLRIKSLLHEIRELKEKGYSIYTTYDENSDINEMRNEVKLGRRFLDLKSSEAMVEKAFFSFVRGIEMIPNFYNPLNIELEGLYEDFMLSKGIINDQISEILKKHTGEGEPLFSPEVKLGGIIFGTIIFRAFILKSGTGTSSQQPLNGWMKFASMAASNFFGGASNQNNQQQQPQQRPQRIEAGPVQPVVGTKISPTFSPIQAKQQPQYVPAPTPLPSTTADTISTSPDISGMFSPFQNSQGPSINRRFDNFNNPQNVRQPLVDPDVAKMADDSERFDVASVSSSEFSSSPKLTSSAANSTKKPRARSKKKSINIF